MDSDQTDDQFVVNNPNDTNPVEDMKRDEQLAEDNDTPFSPPDGVQDSIDDTAQAADGNIDPHERYNAGIQEAANVSPPQPAEQSEDDPSEVV